MTTYPTQKAVAYRLIYGPKWKLGEPPQRIKLGSLLFPVDECIEAKQLKRMKTITELQSELNNAALHAEHGNLAVANTCWWVARELTELRSALAGVLAEHDANERPVAKWYPTIKAALGE